MQLPFVILYPAPGDVILGSLLLHMCRNCIALCSSLMSSSNLACSKALHPELTHSFNQLLQANQALRHPPDPLRQPQNCKASINTQEKLASSTSKLDKSDTVLRAPNIARFATLDRLERFGCFVLIMNESMVACLPIVCLPTLQWQIKMIPALAIFIWNLTCALLKALLPRLNVRLENLCTILHPVRPAFLQMGVQPKLQNDDDFSIEYYLEVHKCCKRRNCCFALRCDKDCRFRCSLISLAFSAARLAFLWSQ